MRKKVQESLVTDQPARKVIFSGILISILLGFFIRGLTQPEFLQTELKRAVSRMHSSTEVSWGSVEVSLKKGLLPRFSVIIQDIKILSRESCWGQPLLYAREMEFPISTLTFFETGQPFQKIITRDGFLEFKSGFACEVKKETTSASVKKEGPRPTVRLRPLKESQTAPPLVLKNFVFENLKIRRDGWAFPDWNFRRLEMNVKENNPWYAELKADFGIPDMEGVETALQLSALYKEFPEKNLEAEIKGHWREGTIHMKAGWGGEEKGYTFSSRFHHIPFQFLKSVAQRTQTPWNWPNVPMWFSFSTESAESFKKWEDGRHLVKSLQVEGDLGDLSISELEIKSVKPFKVQPFRFSLADAQLDTVLTGELKRIGFLSRLGQLSGQGQWSNEKNLLFTGSLKGLEIPLFHKNQKVSQVLRSADLQGELKNGQWLITSQNWQLDKGQIKTQVRVEGPQNFSQGNLLVNLEDFQVAPEILKLMEIVTPQVNVKGRIQARWKDQALQDLNSQLRTDFIENNFVMLDRPQVNLKKSNRQWELKLQAQALQLRQWPSGVNANANPAGFPVTGKNLSSSFQWGGSENENLKWQLTSSTIKSSGQQTPEKILRGSLNLNGELFDIGGTREAMRVLKK